MGWFKKNADPISERARALTAEIAALEDQINKLSTQMEQSQSQPRLRSTAVPHGATITNPSPPVSPVVREPIFEEVDQNQLKARAEIETTPEHYNELGVRKYDLAAFFKRMKAHFRGPSASNPKLINYLAAGSFQGLRPMRYEKRVARNRFLWLVIGFFLLLLGIVSVFVRNK
ncbi:MAG: hypothetical protein HY298_19475 [Verrucomicrobia bacterium]|nr:hypothetical protein [Verrucomicrobiota bacterium]